MTVLVLSGGDIVEGQPIRNVASGGFVVFASGGTQYVFTVLCLQQKRPVASQLLNGDKPWMGLLYMYHT